MVVQIQQRLPEARVMYVSATGAADVKDLGCYKVTKLQSYVKDLGYMSRLVTVTCS